jgi:hypothetical protein
MVPRTPHRGELDGLAARLRDLSDQFAPVDQQLSLSLSATADHLRRYLDAGGPGLRAT